MKCPYCPHEGQPSVSGPIDHPMVPGLVHLVCSGCDTYLSSVTAPMPEGNVTPLRRSSSMSVEHKTVELRDVA